LDHTEIETRKSVKLKVTVSTQDENGINKIKLNPMASAKLHPNIGSNKDPSLRLLKQRIAVSRSAGSSTRLNGPPADIAQDIEVLYYICLHKHANKYTITDYR
jgi:hypothetical protein